MLADSAVWADWFVAGGTLTLAAYTGWLARRTHQANQTSVDLLELEATKADDALQPYVVPFGLSEWVQAHASPTKLQWQDRFPIKNVGPGAALNVTGAFTIAGSETVVSFAPTSLASGDAELVDVQWPARRPHVLGNGEGFIECDDVTGTTWRTLFAISGSRKIEVKGVTRRGELRAGRRSKLSG